VAAHGVLAAAGVGVPDPYGLVFAAADKASAGQGFVRWLPRLSNSKPHKHQLAGSETNHTA
jgi:hypothetical protein